MGSRFVALACPGPCSKLTCPSYFSLVLAFWCMYIILAFLQPVCACTVAKEQNRRICKNIVLMATRFHSTSGFNLSPLIGENVTISVSLWIQKERRPPASCYSSQSTSSTAIKNSFADACACAYTPSKSGGARSVEFLSMGKFFFSV